MLSQSHFTDTSMSTIQNSMKVCRFPVFNIWKLLSSQIKEKSLVGAFELASNTRNFFLTVVVMSNLSVMTGL